MKTLFVILDKEFGEKLSSLPSDSHIWVCESSVNSEACVAMRKLARAVTSFQFHGFENMEQEFLDIFETIVQHHGPYPPGSMSGDWQTLEVRGVTPTENISRRLKEIAGVTIIDKDREIFRGRRKGG